MANIREYLNSGRLFIICLFINYGLGKVVANNLNIFKVVSTEDGLVRGRIKESLYFNKTFYQFLGIPYAQPPLGPLRFKPPIPPTPWKGVLNAFEFRNKCFQEERNNYTAVGSENCLFLNVFVPADAQNKTYAVMLFIMGGAYQSGSAISYGPDFLLSNDVILVTFDYRLGPLGFLSLGTPGFSGNMGLKDQLMVMKWVQKNIANFGGRPDTVTIFGQSAGSSSVNLHMISPQSQGLFHRAIMQSGTATDPWSFRYSTDQLPLILKFARKYGNITSTGPELEEFLMTVPPKLLIVKTFLYFVQGPPPLSVLPNWTPVIEHPNAIQPFLLKSPQEYQLDGRKTKIDSMFGFNTDEALYFIPHFIADPIALEPYNNKFQLQLPYGFIEYKYDSIEYMQAAAQIKYFYFNNERIDNKTLGQFSDLLTDAFFAFGARKSSLLQFHRSKGKTFFYVNNMVTRLNLFRAYSGSPWSIPGSTHGDELFYLFKIKGPLFYHPVPDIYKDISPNSLEVRLIRLITNIWTNFAKNGNPSPDYSRPSLPITKRHLNYLHLTNYGVFLGQDPHKRRMAFWRNFFNMNRFPVKKVAYCKPTPSTISV